jgi:hypothetical protein
MKEVEIVKEMIEYNRFDAEELLSILHSFKNDIALIPLLFNKGEKIIRSRRNDKEDFFYKVSDLSYPPSNCVTRTDRASLKGRPMFYASVFTSDVEKTGALPRIVSALETLNIFKSDHDSKFCFFTQSIWISNEDIHLFAFPVSGKYKRECKELSKLRKDWKIYCKDNYSEKSVDFFSYIGDLMATPGNSCVYDVTATCIDYIITALGFEGVLYPSVPTEGQGLNICLIPKVVDKKLFFRSAIIELVLRKDMQSKIYNFAQTKMNTQTSFEWEVLEDGKEIIRQIYPDLKKYNESNYFIKSGGN